MQQDERNARCMQRVSNPRDWERRSKIVAKICIHRRHVFLIFASSKFFSWIASDTRLRNRFDLRSPGELDETPIHLQSHIPRVDRITHTSY